MESQGMRKRSENIPENPEEYNALLEFPNLNPYNSFVMNEDGPESKSRKKEKSQIRKREKNNRSSRKEADSDTKEKEISPWPVEWQRANKTQSFQYEDSDHRQRHTCAVEKGESDGQREENSRQMPGKTAHDEHGPACSFWKENESIMSEKDISSEPVPPSWSDDSDNMKLFFIHKQGSDTERHGSSRYTVTKKRGAVSETVASPYENERHSKEAEKQDRRPQASATSNDQRFDRYATIPVQSDNIRETEPLSPLCYNSPEQKSHIRHSNNSAVNMCNTSHSVCPQSEFAKVSHKAECSQSFHRTADNNVTEYSGGEGGLPYKRYIGSRVALSHGGRHDLKDVSSERDYTPLTIDTSRDTSFKNSQGNDHARVVATTMTADPGCVAPSCNCSSESQTEHNVKTNNFHEPVTPKVYYYTRRIFSKEPQTSGYLSETPVNLSITADRRPYVPLLHQGEDAQGSIPKQHIASQPSSSAEANQIDLSQNVCSGKMLCDILIKSVPISFLNSEQAAVQNQPQGDPSGNAAIYLDPVEGLLKGSLTITINPASNVRGDEVPTTSDRVPVRCVCCPPPKEKTARFRRKRPRRYLSHQKPQKDNENLADDEMGDESSEDNQETTLTE